IRSNKFNPNSKHFMKYLLLAFGVLMILPLHAQVNKYDFTGQIQDSLQESLVGATAVLLDPADSTMVSFSVSDGHGRFEMTGVKGGSYTWQITDNGYGTFENKVEASGEEKGIDLGEIYLARKTNLLDVIEVKAEF